eukprot:TRINITY_DN6237_c0_g1_i1.p1 TRINITY_DN6237_c0_g1~~TRINITY_DN6237_c0_g1_i1.p1  ORF type:complete len:145 (+),score=44.56 TRINITY_DN6237_c0_g1_i1:44-478(+)
MLLGKISNKIIEGDCLGVEELLNREPGLIKKIIKEYDSYKEINIEYTLLHTAAKCNQEKICKLLIEKGADMNATKFNTAFHLAAELNLENICKLFLDKGMDVDIKTSADYTPLHFAVDKNCFEVCKLLIERGADINAKAFVINI